MKYPSKRMPTRKELGHLKRIYAGTGQLIMGKNGFVRKVKVI